MPTGDAVTYVSGAAHRPIPMAGDARVRPAHRPWCERCKKTRDLTEAGLCEPCTKALEVSARLRAEREAAAEAARPPVAPKEPKRRLPKPRRPRSLTAELEELERTDPKVGAAAASYDDMVARVTRPEDHVIPGNLTPQGEEDAPSAPDPDGLEQAPRPAVPQMPETDLTETIATINRDMVAFAAVTATEPTQTDQEIARAARALRATADSADPATRLLRLSVLASVDALQAFHDLRTIDPGPGQRIIVGFDGSRADDSDLVYAVVPDPPLEATAAPRRRRRSSGPAVDEPAIVAEYQAGSSPPELALKHGIGPKRVRAILDRHGVERRDDRTHKSGGKNRKQSSDDDAQLRDQVIHLYVEGHLATEGIAAQLNIGRKLVAGILQRAGVEMRPQANQPTPLSDDQRAAIVASYRAGSSLANVAKAHHVKVTRVRDIVAAAGVEIRPKGAATQTRARLEALGVTTDQVKAWAVDHGHLKEITRGIVANSLIDLYEAAHAEGRS